MIPRDFFYEEWKPVSEIEQSLGLSSQAVFNLDLVERLRLGTQEGICDVDAAYSLTQLAHGELESFGTDGGQKLDDEQMSVLLRSLKAVLRRLDIVFDPPFRDFRGFHGYWSRNGMSGSWAARRGYLNELFSPVLSKLDEVDIATGPTSICGIDGELKNIIFASTGPKPEIVLRDAINNVIEVVKFSEFSLIYNRPLTKEGLTWGELVAWWRVKNRLNDKSDMEVARSLYIRLFESLGSEAERILFRAYCERYGSSDGFQKPALLPQVYLHYDPLTQKERRTLGKPERLEYERMDFLLLLQNGVRIVLEVDGKQHYAEGKIASPKRYAEMVAEDRALRLRGYDLYRFGGSEIVSTEAPKMLQNFFDALEARYAFLE
jgi:hypothetical protein